MPSEFEGLGTVANLVARGLGIAIMPRLAVGAYESQVVVRDLPTGLDLSRDVFAVARTVGWIAQWKEMIQDPEQKIGRPRQLYTGETLRQYKPMSKR